MNSRSGSVKKNALECDGRCWAPRSSHRARRRVLGGAVLLACFLMLPDPASAFFERLFLSTRTQSMGGAFVAVADDASATVSNPAGLTQVPSVEFLSSLSRPYGLTDLTEAYIAAAVPTAYGALGLSWHRFALEDVTSEDLFTISFGRDLVRTSQDASLSIGAGIDIQNISYNDPNTLNESKTVLSGTLGVLLRPFQMIGLGYTLRNIGEPDFDFVAGGGSTPIEMTHAIGLAYHWNEICSFIYERERRQNGKWQDRFGLELFAGDHLRLRGGLAGTDVTGGFGVVVSRVTIDAGVVTHDVLGTTYMVSVGVALPPRDGEEPTKW
ncbi:MAG: hypothetical protein JSW50_09250 [Candidatus Latescibacterota bacterium]|nr:MAG: hypothetical protein JSW50_09250 [Candidatus Latescibacterota bacterium]